MNKQEVINTENGIKFVEAFNEYVNEVNKFLKINPTVQSTIFKTCYGQSRLSTPNDARCWRDRFYGHEDNPGDIAAVKQLLKDGKTLHLNELAACLHKAVIAFKAVEQDIINQNTAALNLLEEL